MKNLMCFVLIVFLSQVSWANNPEPKSLSVIAFSGLKIRSTPSIDGRVLDVVAFGEKVTVLEESELSETIEWIRGNWIKVSYHNIEGFVFDGFFDRLPYPNIRLRVDTK